VGGETKGNIRERLEIHRESGVARKQKRGKEGRKRYSLDPEKSRGGGKARNSIRT